MAGRPKMMAKRVTLLERKAWDLVGEFNEIIPSMYLDRRVEGKIADAWGECSFMVPDAAASVGALARLLRKKAGLPEPERIEEGSAEPAKEAESQVVGEGDDGQDDRSEELEVHVGDAESGAQGGDT